MTPRDIFINMHLYHVNIALCRNSQVTSYPTFGALGDPIISFASSNSSEVNSKDSISTTTIGIIVGVCGSGLVIMIFIYYFYFSGSFLVEKIPANEIEVDAVYDPVEEKCC
jgi:L-lactate permease